MDPSQLEEPDEALRQQLLSTIPHFEDIYISNENITALPQGRKPDTLRRLATESHQDTLHRKDDGEARFRQALETMDTMEDPLDVYLKHIAWIDQVYLQGNQHQSPLNDTLKMAVHRFEDEEKYKHDLRFLRCWLRLASLQEDPQKIYLYLIHKKIGQTSALFYVEYCKYYAKRKKYTEAGKVLESGINNSAVPMKMLEKARAALEAEIEQSQPSPSSTELHQERMRDLAKHGRSILGVIYDASKPTGRGVGVSGSNRLSGLGAGGLGRLNPPRTPLGLGSRKRTLTPHTSMPVFNDTDRTPEPTLPPPQTTLNLTPPKTTENKIASEPMQGAILKSRPCKKPKKDTFVVYRDTPVSGSTLPSPAKSSKIPLPISRKEAEELRYMQYRFNRIKVLCPKSADSQGNIEYVSHIMDHPNPNLMSSCDEIRARVYINQKTRAAIKEVKPMLARLSSSAFKLTLPAEEKYDYKQWVQQQEEMRRMRKTTNENEDGLPVESGSDMSLVAFEETEEREKKQSR